MPTTTFEELCSRLSSGSSTDLSALLPEGIQQEVGHFNVFNLAGIIPTAREKSTVSCASRAFYKISFLTGHSRAEYLDRTVEIARPTLVFSTPKTPFYWSPIGQQTGQFCVFTAEFLHPTQSGVILDKLPIFRSPEHPVYALSDDDIRRVQGIFNDMQAEITSNYAYKYDLLRAYTLELIHLGQNRTADAVAVYRHASSQPQCLGANDIPVFGAVGTTISAGKPPTENSPPHGKTVRRSISRAYQSSKQNT